MSQMLVTGLMIFILQGLMEAYWDHPVILGLSVENAQGNFDHRFASMKMNLEYNSTNRSSYNSISICIPT